MAITAVVATWLAFYQFIPSIALTTVSWFLATTLAMHAGSTVTFFWLPLLASLNYILLIGTPVWFSPRNEIVIASAIFSSLISIYVYSKSRTLKHFKEKDNRNGVLVMGIRTSGLAGICSGLMLAGPYFVASSMMTVFGIYITFPTATLAVIVFPFLFGILGLLLGIVFGFVFDIMVALEFKNRSRASKSRDNNWMNRSRACGRFGTSIG